MTTPVVQRQPWRRGKIKRGPHLRTRTIALFQITGAEAKSMPTGHRTEHGSSREAGCVLSAQGCLWLGILIR